MKQNKKVGRMIIILLLVCCLSLLPVFAYSGTLNIGRISADGNNSNFTVNVFDGIPLGLDEANSSNYTVQFETYDYAMEKTIVPPPAEEENPPNKHSSSSGSSISAWPTTPTGTETIVPDISYGVLVSSKNKTLSVENKKEDVVLKGLEVKLIDNLTGEKTNVIIQIVQVGEIKTREESLSFFGYQYHMLEINHEDLNNNEIKSAKIDFSVSDNWLQEHHITKDDIYLFRYTNGEWKELKTIYEDANATHYFYSALSPGLSSFMIGTKEDVVEQQQDINPNTITGNTVDEDNSTTNTGIEKENNGTENNETSTDTGFLKENMFFGLDNAIALLIIGVILAVIIIAGVGFAMKHNHIHTTRKADEYQQIPPQTTTQQSQPTQAVESEDFVDTIVGHVDAKAQEIAEQVSSTIDEPQPPNTQIKLTSVREETAQVPQEPVNQKAPKELDFTGHEEEALAHYVKQVISAGYTKELYTKALLTKGWTRAQIDYCVEKIIKEHIQAPSRTKN